MRPRLAAFVLFALLASVVARNPLIHYGGDDLLIAVTFFAAFLPLGACCSLERRWRRMTAAPVAAEVAGAPPAAAGTTARSPAPAKTTDRSPAPPEGTTARSAATAAYTGQVLLVFFMAGVHKTGDEWWGAGTAISMALHVEVFATDFGRLLRTWDALLRPLTWLALAIECLAPLLALVPRTWCRAAGVAALAALQVGIGLGMEVGLFWWIAVVALVPLTPPAAVEALCARWRARRENAPPRGRWTTRLARLVRPGWAAGRARRGEDAAGAAHARRAAGHAGAPARASRTRASWRRDALLRVAGVVCFGRGVDREGGAAPSALRALARAVVLTALATVVVWNASGHPAAPAWVADLRPLAAPFVGGFHLLQHWTMFAPHPYRTDEWRLLPALARDGRRVHALTGRPLHFEPPRSGSAHHGGFRWHEVVEVLAERSDLGRLLAWQCGTGRWRYLEVWRFSRPNLGNAATADGRYTVSREAQLRCGEDDTGVAAFEADMDKIRLAINFAAY